MENNYAEIYAAAIAESGMGSEILPDDNYTVKIATVKPDASKNGKFRVGIRLQVTSGPHEGKSTWVNQTFTGDNPKAVAIFLRLMKELGGQPVEAAIQAALPPEQIVAYIAVGTEGVATIAHHTFGTNDDGSARKFQDLKKFVASGAASPVQAPAAAVPAPQPQAAPAPAPAPASVPGAVPSPF